MLYSALHSNIACGATLAFAAARVAALTSTNPSGGPMERMAISLLLWAVCTVVTLGAYMLACTVWDHFGGDHRKVDRCTRMATHTLVVVGACLAWVFVSFMLFVAISILVGQNAINIVGGCLIATWIAYLCLREDWAVIRPHVYDECRCHG